MPSIYKPFVIFTINTRPAMTMPTFHWNSFEKGSPFYRSLAAAVHAKVSATIVGHVEGNVPSLKLDRLLMLSTTNEQRECHPRTQRNVEFTVPSPYVSPSVRDNVENYVIVAENSKRLHMQNLRSTRKAEAAKKADMTPTIRVGDEPPPVESPAPSPWLSRVMSPMVSIDEGFSMKAYAMPVNYVLPALQPWPIPIVPLRRATGPLRTTRPKSPFHHARGIGRGAQVAGSLCRRDSGSGDARDTLEATPKTPSQKRAAKRPAKSTTTKKRLKAAPIQVPQIAPKFVMKVRSLETLQSTDPLLSIPYGGGTRIFDMKAHIMQISEQYPKLDLYLVGYRDEERPAIASLHETERTHVPYFAVHGIPRCS
jgi:hypothetical protein